jgi:hypothetical protein
MVKVVAGGGFIRTGSCVRPDKCVRLQDVSLGQYKAVMKIN